MGMAMDHNVNLSELTCRLIKIDCVMHLMITNLWKKKKTIPVKLSAAS